MRPQNAMSFVTSLLCALLAQTNAFATITSAQAYAAISGEPVFSVSETLNSFGASKSGGLFYEFVSVSSSASSSAGALHAEVTAVAKVATTANGSARADWRDKFIIPSPGVSSGAIGTLSGSVSVSGGLETEYEGRSTAISSVQANLSISGNTGFNGGGVSLQGGGRHVDGYQLGDYVEGLESFSLVFSNIPFTFGQAIDIYLALEVTALAAPGAFFDPSEPEKPLLARATAGYGSSLKWGGITEVRDQFGSVIQNFTAISPDSGFDFARPVPEMSSASLLLFGIFLMSIVSSSKSWLTRLFRPTAG